MNRPPLIFFDLSPNGLDWNEAHPLSFALVRRERTLIHKILPSIYTGLARRLSIFSAPSSPSFFPFPIVHGWKRAKRRGQSEKCKLRVNKWAEVRIRFAWRRDQALRYNTDYKVRQNVKRSTNIVIIKYLLEFYLIRFIKILISVCESSQSVHKISFAPQNLDDYLKFHQFQYQSNETIPLVMYKSKWPPRNLRRCVSLSWSF